MFYRAMTSTELASVRARYDAGERVGEIARLLAMTPSTFRRWRHDQGWPMRGGAAVRRGRKLQQKTRKASVPAEGEPLDTFQLIRAMRRAVEGELVAITAAPATGSGESRSRALASLTRTLTVLRGLEAQAANERASEPNHDDDTLPVDLAELRNELARRLFEICEGRDDS